MTAHIDNMKNKDILTVLGVITSKFDCKITNIDLEQGLLQIKGRNKETEDICMYEIQAAFSKISEECGVI